ncbi:MAG: RsmE family RNA methyltransferase [bacterium]
MKFVDTYFYAPPSNIEDETITFPSQELQHISRVLRLKKGDVVIVVDGEGHTYEAEIVVSRKGELAGHVIRELGLKNETKTNFYLGLPLIKPSHLEIAIDMVVQLGAKGLWIFKPDRVATEWDAQRIANFTERVKRLMISSMKQSKRAYLPELIPTGKLDDILKFRSRFKGIFYGHPFGIPAFATDFLTLNESYLLLVGPEGDFSHRELEFLEDVRALPISLGPRRLRTETAIVALFLKALAFAKEV